MIIYWGEDSVITYHITDRFANNSVGHNDNISNILFSSERFLI
jgi:hypothetical protein